MKRFLIAVATFWALALMADNEQHTMSQLMGMSGQDTFRRTITTNPVGRAAHRVILGGSEGASGGTVTPVFSSAGLGWTNCSVTTTNPLIPIACSAVTVINANTNNPVLMLFLNPAGTDDQFIEVCSGFGYRFEGITNTAQVGVSSKTGTHAYVPFNWVK